MGKVFDLNGKDLTKTDTTLRVPEEPADAAEVGKRNDAQTESLKAEKSRAEGAEKKLQQQVDTLNAGGLNLKEDLIRTQVDSYLTQHPEAMGTAVAEETTRAKAAEEENAKGIGQLKEDLGDFENKVIISTISDDTEDITGFETIQSTIIMSNGKLSSNEYTSSLSVMKLVNPKVGKYQIRGYCQGNQCVYVLCKSDGTVIEYENATTQGSSGTKTLDVTVSERNCILYVGAYTSNTNRYIKMYLESVSLSAKLSSLYKKKVTLNGDSIAYGQGTGGTGFMDYIAEKYSMTLDKKAVSGGTIADLSARYPDKHSVCTSVDTMAEDADYVIFEGGYNDWYLWTQIGAITDTMSDDLDTSKFYGALESICRQALEIWKGKKIGFVITHKINDAWRTQKQEGNTYPTLEGYYDAIRKVCDKYSIPYLDLSRISRFNTEIEDYKPYTYNSDGIHPTEDGYKIFYVDAITKWMENL